MTNLLCLETSSSVFIAACIGTPVVLDGSAGTFSSNGTQYGHAMDCSWKIQVAPSKVNSTNQLTRLRSTMLTRFSRKGNINLND